MRSNRTLGICIEPRTDQLILDYSLWLRKQGLRESTIILRVRILTLLVKRNAELLNPESIKEVISKQNWSEGRKKNAVEAYQGIVNMNGLNWSPPRYNRIIKMPFIPTEKEVDQLISGVSSHISAFTQLLKETAIRPGEAWQIRWMDLDSQNNTIRITPEKNSYPRQHRISNQLVSMLLRIQNKDNFIFRGRFKSLNNLGRTFHRQRVRIAEKLANPRIKEITFRTFRH